MVTVALHTGMRKGEILGLTWERVDFARGVLQLEHTKSGRRREVPMNRAVYDALVGLLGPKAEGFVFRKRAGRAWGNVRTAFEDACRAAKVGFHDLRHTCASWLVMKGRSQKEVQEILGHREFTMTVRPSEPRPAPGSRRQPRSGRVARVARPIAHRMSHAQVTHFAGGNAWQRGKARVRRINVAALGVFATMPDRMDPKLAMPGGLHPVTLITLDAMRTTHCEGQP